MFLICCWTTAWNWLVKSRPNSSNTFLPLLWRKKDQRGYCWWSHPKISLPQPLAGVWSAWGVYYDRSTTLVRRHHAHRTRLYIRQWRKHHQSCITYVLAQSKRVSMFFFDMGGLEDIFITFATWLRILLRVLRLGRTTRAWWNMSLLVARGNFFKWSSDVS